MASRTRLTQGCRQSLPCCIHEPRFIQYPRLALTTYRRVKRRRDICQEVDTDTGARALQEIPHVLPLRVHAQVASVIQTTPRESRLAQFKSV